MIDLLSSLPGAVAQGLIWGIMAVGVYITYKLLDIADLTVDGSICTGAAVCTMMLLSGRSLWLAVLCAVVLVFWMGNLSTPVTAEEAGIWLYNKKEDGANLCVLEVQGENVRLETEGGFSWGKEYITVRAMRYTFPGLHAALTKLTGSEIVSTEIAVSRTQVLAVECADGTRYYSDSQQVERFIAGENPDGTVRYGYGTEEQYGHDFKKG